jgi:YjbE family integral membrane protein
MQFGSSEFVSSLLAIILIDLVLAGDNALVIGIAARNVPRAKQRAVILWGTLGAIAVRVLMTGAVVWLLEIPGFMLGGGLALIWIAYKLGVPQQAHPEQVAAAATLAAAVRTIIVADAVMGVDNVLAIGGAAQGSFLLVVLGLAISVPIVVWGSTLVLKSVDRFPVILWLGVGVLGWTAAKMIANERLLAPVFSSRPAARTLLYVLVVGGLVVIPVLRSLDPPRRARLMILAAVAAWLSAFGWLEDRFGVTFDLFEHWRWDDELIDLIRWVGWIPLAIGLDRRLARHAAPD